MSVLGSAADQDDQHGNDDKDPFEIPLTGGMGNRQPKLPSIKFTRFHGHKNIGYVLR